MKIIKSASNESMWRGLGYFENKKVYNVEQINENEYTSNVKGQEEYEIYLNLLKPRKSTCNCPHAKGRMVMCKHIVATYFTIFPSEVDVFNKEVEEHNKNVDEFNKQLEEKMLRHIKKMSKQELQEELIRILYDSPEWIYDRFIKEHILWKDR